MKTNELFIPDGISGEFRWETEYYHPDNAFTMQDFLDNHLLDSYEILFVDSSYCEIKFKYTDFIYKLDAKGDGDSYHHVVNWKFDGLYIPMYQGAFDV